MVADVLKQGMLPRTAKTLTDAATLKRTLEEVRVAGYAIDDEESEEGMRCVAAPVRDISGKVIAAVGLAGPTQRLTKKDLRTMAPEVVSAGDAVSFRLGWRP